MTPLIKGAPKTIEFVSKFDEGDAVSIPFTQFEEFERSLESRSTFWVLFIDLWDQKSEVIQIPIALKHIADLEHFYKDGEFGGVWAPNAKITYEETTDLTRVSEYMCVPHMVQESHKSFEQSQTRTPTISSKLPLPPPPPPSPIDSDPEEEENERERDYFKDQYGNDFVPYNKEDEADEFDPDLNQDVDDFGACPDCGYYHTSNTVMCH